MAKRFAVSPWCITPSTSPRDTFQPTPILLEGPASLISFPEIPERVYTVGRLDEESTGLMILTNDGELANRLAHPRYGVEKLYRALIAGAPDQEVLAKLTAGVWLSDGKIRAKRARLVGRQGQAHMLELVLAEGKNREIRRMLAKLGHKVMSLSRIAVGPVSVKGLSSGEHRSLSRHEVELLWKVANGAEVSFPRFLDGESPHRARGDSRRQPQSGGGRRERNRPGPPRRQHGQSRREPGPVPGAKQSPPPLSSHPTQSPPPPSRRPDSAPRNTRPSHDSSASKPLNHERSGGAPRTDRSMTPKHAPASSRRSATPPPTRRIIGLEPQAPTAAEPATRTPAQSQTPPAQKLSPVPITKGEETNISIPAAGHCTVKMHESPLLHIESQRD